ncbi:uncharacterized protein LOC133555693 [Nerophis ophidion]|uniref:uncharacterized protein LOC133555693 n=1 Tax=Nerophis ophidion TaxID=159077 RepID=UPI002ADFF80B|nr:uncharacterized protein LOC133555693 [Nerophis ophidion]
MKMAPACFDFSVCGPQWKKFGHPCHMVSTSKVHFPTKTMHPAHQPMASPPKVDHYGGCTPRPSPHDFNNAGPSPNVHNTSGPSPGIHKRLPPSRMNPPENNNAAFLAPGRKDADNPSVEDTICYQPQAEKSWTPCDGCREELEKIRREKQRIEEVLLKIDPGQVRVLQTLCDLVGDKYSDGPPQQSDQQELFPESGVFISSFRLAAMRHASKPKCMRLFHALFDLFFYSRGVFLLVALETNLQEHESASLTGKKLKES